MQYPGAVALINKAEYWFVSKLEHGANNNIRFPVTWNYTKKKSALCFLACQQEAMQQFFTQNKAASHIREEATTSAQMVPAAEVILGDRNQLLRHVKSTRTIKNGIFGLMMLRLSLRSGVLTVVQRFDTKHIQMVSLIKILNLRPFRWHCFFRVFLEDFFRKLETESSQQLICVIENVSVIQEYETIWEQWWFPAII